MTRPERFDFPGAGGEQLAARLDRPAGEPVAFALFAHCFTCGKDVIAAGAISKALAANGIAVLRFDFTGLGSSEGEFANTDFSSNVADLIAAADHLRERHEAPRLLVGHSLGGAAVLAAAARIDEVAAVATIGAPADPAHVEHLLDGSIEEIEAAGEAEVTLAGRSFRVRREFLADVRAQALLPAVAELGRPVAVFHAPGDELVGIDNARRIFEAARHPKSFVSLDDADHLLSDRADATYAGLVLAAWAGRYMAPRPGERRKPKQ
jgi:alpha-beta hydrolase superfamily lysophospholipase